MEEKAEMKFIKKRWIIILAILLVFLLLLYFIASYFSDQITWQYAERYTYFDTAKFNAVVIRDEQVITSQNTGNRYYCCYNGEKIAKGKAVAEYYSSADILINKRRISEITNKISYLKKIDEQNSFYKADEGSNSLQIKNTIYDMVNCIDNNLLSNLPESNNKLERLMNIRTLIRNERTDFKSVISNYESQLDSLKSSSSELTGEDYAPESGYFLNYTDGFETKFDFSKVYEMSKMPSLEKAEKNDKAIGKIVKGAKSYIVFEVDAELGKSLSNKSTVKVKLPTFAEKLVVSVDAVNKSGNGYIVVLSTMSENVMMLSTRSTDINIYMNECSGLKIDSKALRTIKNSDGKVETGVYIQVGKQIKFREVEVEYSGKDIVIVKEGGELKVRDEVVIGGNDLAAKSN